MESLAELVGAGEPTVLHFSGHGREGRLLFEDPLGLAEEVPVEELARRLRLALLNPARRGHFPSLFFLSSRGTFTTGPATEPTDLESGLSTPGSLHRAGFAQVVALFAPLDGELATRAEEAFYGALARGTTALEAAATARATLLQPLGEQGVEWWYPLGDTLLTVYQRGADRPTANGSRRPGDTALVRRRRIELGGLPVLERGFIGRRGLQSEILRRIAAGERLLVLQGLGGLGKTALASQLLVRVLAPEEAADRLILRCRELSKEAGDPLLDLWAQAEEHGRLQDLAGWSGRVRLVRSRFQEPVEGLATTIREIRKDRPHLVVYVDNAESLQVGPLDGDARTLGSWREGLEAWWLQMERIAEEGTLVLVTTRYLWQGIRPQAHVAVGPLSEADTWRLLESFETLAGLPREARLRLARNLGGHPRAAELLDRLAGLQVPGKNRQHPSPLALGDRQRKIKHRSAGLNSPQLIDISGGRQTIRRDIGRQLFQLPPDGSLSAAGISYCGLFRTSPPLAPASFTARAASRTAGLPVRASTPSAEPITRRPRLTPS